MLNLIGYVPSRVCGLVLDALFGKSDLDDYVSTTTPPPPPAI